MQVSYGNYRCLCIVVTKLNKESYQCYKNAYDRVDVHLLTLEKKVTPCENNLVRAYIWSKTPAKKRQSTNYYQLYKQD